MWRFACEQFGVSERRACKLLDVTRATYRYEPRPDRNAELREELMALARQKPRYAVVDCTHCWNVGISPPA